MTDEGVSPVCEHLFVGYGVEVGGGRSQDRAAVLEAENYRLRAEHARLRERVEAAERAVEELRESLAA